MEVAEFRNVLSKAITIVDEGIKKGYFDESRRDELNSKLLRVIRNGLVFDIPGTAIYGAYYPSEKRLVFNAKVFKNEEEALVYVLHEMKHALDHYDDCVGFEVGDSGVGMNEGATQRFATDLAEEILHIEIPRESHSSLGVNMTTHLDEYQLEDKINELFCIAMGISMEDFIRMQNDPKKEEFNRLIERFNSHSNFEELRNLLDQIYHIQEETWFDNEGNFLDKEKEPTGEQTERTIKLINRLKELIIQYALVENPTVVDRIKAEAFMGINGSGEVLRDDFSAEMVKDKIKSDDEVLDENALISQDDYLKYQDSIISQIGSNLLNNECSIVFVTEFRYDRENLPKTVYFRKGDSYRKLIIPMKEDKTLDINGAIVGIVDDVHEILEDISDCEAEFRIIANGEEYARILRLVGEEERALDVLRKWNYYLSKKDEIEDIRIRSKENHESNMAYMSDLFSSLRNDSDLSDGTGTFSM